MEHTSVFLPNASSMYPAQLWSKIPQIADAMTWSGSAWVRVCRAHILTGSMLIFDRCDR